MRKISKKTIKRIKEGYHDDLMEAIEFLIDSYNDDEFENGYKSCIDDLPVHSYRLAEHILKAYKQKGLNDNELAQVIEEYFTNALKE